MRLISKKEEQHGLASRWLHEVMEWEPPRRRRKQAPPQLPGQLDITTALAEDDDEEAAS